MPDHFNHVAGSLIVLPVLCEIRRFVTKPAFYTQSSVEGPHNGAQIFCLLHLQNLEISGRMVESGPSPPTFFPRTLLDFLIPAKGDAQTYEQKKVNDQWCEF